MKLREIITVAGKKCARIQSEFFLRRMMLSPFTSNSMLDLVLDLTLW